MAEKMIVNILGELVSLDDKESGLSPGDPILVPFSTYYVHPDFTDGDKTTLKQAFRKVFNTSIEPLPPCEKKEKDLIIKSLTHRFGLLRSILLENSKDSKAFRVAAEHAFRLKAYLEFFEKTAECSDAGAESKLSRIEPLDDAMIQALIRQFVFLILQGENPLEKYQGADPSPKQFVQRLKDGKLDNFDEFLGDYRGANLPIAARLAKLLEVSELDLSAIQKLIDEGIQQKMDELIKQIKEVVPKDDPMFVGVNWNDLKSIVDKLVEKIKSLEDEVKKLKEKEGTLNQQHTANQGLLVQKDEEMKSLNDTITKIEAELEASKAAAAKCSTNSDTSKKAQETGQIELDRLKGIYEQSDKDYQSLLLRIPSLEAEIKRLHDEITRLQDIISSLKRPETGLEALKVELEDVKKQLEVEKTKTSDLNRQLAEIEGKLTVQCDNSKKLLTDQYEQRIAVKQKELDDLKDKYDIDIAAKQKEFDDLKDSSDAAIAAAIAVKQKEFDDLKSSSDAAIAAKQKELDELKTKYEDLTTGSTTILTDKNLEIEKVKAELEKVKAELEKETTQGSSNRGAAQAYVSDLEKELNDLKKQVKDALTTIAALTQERDELIEKLKKCDGLQEIINKLTLENTSLKTQIQILNTELDIKLQKIKELEDEIGRIGREGCNELIRQLGELKTEIRSLREKVGQLESQNELLEANQTSNQEEKTKLQEQLNQAKNDLANTNGELEATNKELEVLEGNLANTNGELEATNKELEVLEEKLANTQEELKKSEEEKIKIKGEFDLLKVEKDDLFAKYTALLAENEGLKNEIGTLKKKIEELTERISTINTDCSGKDEEIQRLKSQLNDELTKNQEALKQLQEFQTKMKEEIDKVRLEKVAALAEADRKKKEELDALRKEHNVEIQHIANRMKEWLKSPNDTYPFTTGPYSEVFDSINTLLKTKDQEIANAIAKQSPQNAKAKSEATSRHCYMLFFAAHTMSVHFPTYDERQMNAEKSRISEYIQSILYGVYMKGVQFASVKGLFSEDLISKDKTTHPEKKLLDVLIKLLNLMETYYDLKNTDEKEYSTLEKDTETLDLISKKVTEVLSKKAMKIEQFQAETAKYMNVRLGENGGHIEKVYYYRNDGKPIIGTQGDVVVLVSGKPKYTLTFPICFYLFIFTMKEYFNRIGGELEKTCPIPMILKRKGTNVNNITVEQLK